MKKYVFLTGTVSNIGGMQLYIRNKMLYLRGIGWDVDIISAESFNVLIPDLMIFNKSCRELMYKKYLFLKSRQETVLEKLSGYINKKDDDELYIESTSVTLSTWGESLSEFLGAKHLVYLVDESINISNRGIKQFLEFKHQRRELASIYPLNFVGKCYTNEKSPIEVPVKLIAQASFVEADIDSPFLEFIKKDDHDFVVGFFSRLVKPFVKPALNGIREYFNNYKSKRFLLLVIGDNNIPETIEIEQMFQSLAHVKVIITGRLYPVPTRLLELCDVFISSAGCSNVCRRSGVPTISYDAIDHQPIGVLGYTTESGVYRPKGEKVPCLRELLDQILFEKKYPRSTSHYLTEFPDYKEHIDFIENSCKTKDYFNINTIRPDSCLEYLMKFVLILFGFKNFCRLAKKYKKAMGTVKH